MLSVFAFAVVTPAFAEAYIMINEVELNPIGDDRLSATEWIELYNPTDSPVDLTGWEIASTTLFKKVLTLPGGTVIEPGSLKIYSHVPSWFTDTFESVELRHPNGTVIDKTPLLTDDDDDGSSWQRIYDGLDTDDISDWKFAPHTLNRQNGKQLSTLDTEPVTISISSEPLYKFGDTALISGSVSEEIIVQTPVFYSEPILITIIGPNYQDTRTLYPSPDLTYITTFSLNPSHGLTIGNYTVSAAYAGAVNATSFVLEPKRSEMEKITDILTISTDKIQYVPGETILLNGITNKLKLFTGVTFTITDPDGEPLNKGIMFPLDGGFSTNVLLPKTVTNLGTYTIDVQYADLSANTTFVVSTTPQSDEQISTYRLVTSTDKRMYNYGDIMTVAGSITGTDNSRIPSGSSIDITITKSDGSRIHYRGQSGVLSPIVDVYGAYRTQLEISDSFFDLGNYTLQARYENTSALATFTVSDKAVSSGIDLTLDKNVYSLGEQLVLDGTLSSSASALVMIIITNPDGSTSSHTAPVNNNQFTWSWITPDHAINAGTYTITVSTNSFTKNIQFKLSTDTKDVQISQKPLSISIPRDLYSIGETVVVTGHVNIDDIPNQGFKAPHPVRVSILGDAHKGIHDAFVLPDVHGSFTTSFDLLRHISNPGIYTVQAKYLTHTDTDTFMILGDPTLYSDIRVGLSLDKTEYNPGDTLKITGKPMPLVDLQQLNITLVQRLQDRSACDPDCAAPINSTSTAVLDSTAVLTHTLQIPDVPSSVGSYQITVESDFSSDVIYFDVVPVVVVSIPVPNTIIEKDTDLTDTTHLITLAPKDVNGTTFTPRALIGSLSADSVDVNLTVKTPNGICLIGQDDQCMISESTRSLGQVYQTVDVNGLMLYVRYSGSDVSSERFTVLPDPSSDSVLDGDWTVEIDQETPFTFDYKVTYRAQK